MSRLILASGSAARAQLLTNAGLTFAVQPADVDEAAIRQTVAADQMPPADVAGLLADVKATTVSAEVGDVPVIGADQILFLGERIFTKPANRDDAIETLLALSGQTHTLASAVSVAVGGQVTWRHVGLAHLTMRSLTPPEIGRYLSAAGPSVHASVGAYQLEALGVQLFERIDGDYFTILGLPLLALLAHLRAAHGLEM